jgi:hypothetical protein
MLNNTVGDVIEFGCGFYSTPLIAYMCQSLGRKSESYDINSEWVNRVKEYFDNVPKLNHILSNIENYDKINLDNRHFGLAFIDQEAASRGLMIKRLIDKSDFFVIHDSECSSVYHYDEIFHLFKWRYDFKFFYNWTSVLSNKENPEKVMKLI